MEIDLSQPTSIDNILKSSISHLEEWTKLSYKWLLNDSKFVEAFNKELRQPLEYVLEGVDTDIIPKGKEVLISFFTRRIAIWADVRSTMLTKQPELDRVAPVIRPIIVIGLPRSATTFFHRVLTRDPRARAMAYWELFYPGQVPVEERKRESQSILEMLSEMCPWFSTYHNMDLNESDECDTNLDNAALNVNMALCFKRLENYRNWVFHGNHVDALQYHRSTIQLCQMQNPIPSPFFFLLKSPYHLFWFRDLMQVFPDARVLWIHRNPQKCMPSVCSIMNDLASLWRWEKKDRDWQTRAILEVYSNGLKQSLAVREEMQKSENCKASFADVPYSIVESDPVAACKLAYSQFGMELTDEAAASMTQYVLDDRAKPRPAHTYKIDDGGLSPDDINSSFDFYYKSSYSKFFV